MPLYDYHCPDCGHEWESFEWSSGKDAPEECPECSSRQFYKVFTTIKHEVRMDPNSVKHDLPDPIPPLTELKPRKGSESGMKDLPRTELKDYTRTRDKHGNAVWREKRRTYFGAGGSRRSSGERNS